MCKNEKKTLSYVILKNTIQEYEDFLATKDLLILQSLSCQEVQSPSSILNLRLWFFIDRKCIRDDDERNILS